VGKERERKRGEGRKKGGREGKRKGKKGSRKGILAIPMLVCFRRRCSLGLGLKIVK